MPQRFSAGERHGWQEGQFRTQTVLFKAKLLQWMQDPVWSHFAGMIQDSRACQKKAIVDRRIFHSKICMYNSALMKMPSMHPHTIHSCEPWQQGGWSLSSLVTASMLSTKNRQTTNYGLSDHRTVFLFNSLHLKHKLNKQKNNFGPEMFTYVFLFAW